MEFYHDCGLSIKSKRNVYMYLLRYNCKCCKFVCKVVNFSDKLLPVYRERWPFQAGTKTQGSLNHGQARIQCIPVNKVVDK